MLFHSSDNRITGIIGEAHEDKKQGLVVDNNWAIYKHADGNIAMQINRINGLKVYWHKSPDSPHHYLVGEGPVDV